MKNVTQFRNGFVNLPDAKENNNELAMSVVSELMQFGYVADESAIKNLSSASEKEIEKFHNEIIPFLKEATGVKRNHKPFWKGFPQEVMEKTESELWLEQIKHYLSEGDYEPNDWTRERPTAFERPKYTIITAGNDEKLSKIFTDLVSVNQSLTPDDLNVVKWFANNSGVILVFPEVIPFKENLCTLAGMGLDVPVKTVTDVLRVAVSMSGGDISLPKVPRSKIKTNRWSSVLSLNPRRELFKFKKFTRKERKFLLGLIEKTNCDISEAVLKDQRWLRLGEILHPGEYKTKFPKAFKMFNAIRNQKKHKVQSWYGKLNNAFAKSFEAGLKVLTERPGEFMRRLDALVRSDEGEIHQKEILTTLEKVAAKVSNKVLFEAYTHFDKRASAKTDRTIMVKGSRKRTKLPDLAPIDQSIIDAIQNSINKSLINKFSTLPTLGKVWVDEQLKNIPLPSNMRSMNSSLKPRVRGQRIPMGNQNAKVIRAYVHWYDERGHQDIDLTATFLGIGKIKHIGWNGEKNCKEGCYSGDVRHRQGACAEYIDIDIAATLKSGYKYVILDARNYNGGSFESVTDCVFGYMEREHPAASMTFVPKTITDAIRLTSESSTTIVAMIDVETQEYIFLDIDQDGIPVASANFNALLDAIKPYMEAPKFSVYNLVLMHVNARGGDLVEKHEAKALFSLNDFSESYVETLKLMGV